MPIVNGVEITEAQAAQLYLSIRDKKHWMRNFYQIPVVGKGATLFDMRDYQEDVVDRIDEHDLIIGLKARQIGWTTVSVAYTLYDCLFSEEHPWLFVSRTEDAATKMLDKAKYAYTRLPAWMRQVLPKITNQTQTSLVFENGSRIESVPATGSTGRGDSVYGALLDECAFMEYATEIWTAVEPLVYGKAMLFSTANGMGNFFHEVYLDSQRPDSVWHDIFYPWDVVPARDEAWYTHTKLSFRGREWAFYQEYPSNPTEAFAKSGRVAFDYKLTSNSYRCEATEPELRYEWVVGEGPRLMADDEDADIVVNVWHKPYEERDEHNLLVRRPNFVISADIAEGLEHGDFTYVTVFDANRNHQMMSCKSSIPVSYLDDLLEWFGYYYYTALMIPERNNAGIMPIETIMRHRFYPRMYRMDQFATRQGMGDRTPRYGWRTDRATKPKMVHDFIYAIAEEAVTLHDPEFLLEAQTFVADGKGSYAATEGNHDDVIMGTLVGWQGILDVPDYPPIYYEDDVRTVTHQDFDNLVFNNEPEPSILYKPIGRRPQEKTKKSLVMAPGNVTDRPKYKSA